MDDDGKDRGPAALASGSRLRAAQLVVLAVGVAACGAVLLRLITRAAGADVGLLSAAVVSAAAAGMAAVAVLRAGFLVPARGLFVADVVVWVARFAAVCAGTVLITSLLESASLAVVIGVAIVLGAVMVFVVPRPPRR